MLRSRLAGDVIGRVAAGESDGIDHLRELPGEVAKGDMPLVGGRPVVRVDPAAGLLSLGESLAQFRGKHVRSTGAGGARPARTLRHCLERLTESLARTLQVLPATLSGDHKRHGMAVPRGLTLVVGNDSVAIQKIRLPSWQVVGEKIEVMVEALEHPGHATFRVGQGKVALGAQIAFPRKVVALEVLNFGGKP